MTDIDIKAFLRDLWFQGVEFWLENKQLRFRGNKNLMTGDTLQVLRQNKEAAIALIEESPDSYTGFPLSHGQRAIHIMQTMAPESFAYNQVCLLKLSSKLDIGLLESSLDIMLQRHAPLRMTVKNIDGNMAQQVNFSLPSILSTQEHDIHSKQELRQWVDEQADKPFAVDSEPLIRAILLTNKHHKRTPYHLLFVVHHIVADFWALELIIKELQTIYLSNWSGEAPNLPETNKLYKDYLSCTTCIFSRESVLQFKRKNKTLT